MKKSLKKLSLNKQMISSFKSNEIKGGWGCDPAPGGGSRFICITGGALNTCPPPGMVCF